MPLKISVSGIRGTEDQLTDEVVRRFVGGLAIWLKEHTRAKELTVCVGRDARPWGSHIEKVAIETLRTHGVGVVRVGLVPTPTLGVAVCHLGATAGIMITASHNPPEWNGLKFYTSEGWIFPEEAMKEILNLAESEKNKPVKNEHPAPVTEWTGALEAHISKILTLDEVDRDAIAREIKEVVVDGVGSVGGVGVPMLLEKLGVRQIHRLYCEPTGHFPHPPEPLKENLGELMNICAARRCIGLAVDPDGDRLALVAEDGTYPSEEYTLALCAECVLKSREPAPVVKNVATSMVVDSVTRIYGVECVESRVGEGWVVAMIRAVGATIGGEGNGGVIHPKVQWSRDALTATALGLSFLATEGITLKEWVTAQPHFHMIKDKVNSEIQLSEELINSLQEALKPQQIDTTDGVKLRWADCWLLVRPSGTEPITRIYSEAPIAEKTKHLVNTARKILMRYHK